MWLLFSCYWRTKHKLKRHIRSVLTSGHFASVKSSKILLAPLMCKCVAENAHHAKRVFLARIYVLLYTSAWGYILVIYFIHAMGNVCAYIYSFCIKYTLFYTRICKNKKKIIFVGTITWSLLLNIIIQRMLLINICVYVCRLSILSFLYFFLHFILCNFFPFSRHIFICINTMSVFTIEQLSRAVLYSYERSMDV